MARIARRQSGTDIYHGILRGDTTLLWQFGGGYVELNANGTPTGWNYYVTDHLGSTRMVVDSNDSIRETVNYYPFGSEMRMENPALLGDDYWQRFRFTGKELVKTNDLNMYDFGARWYDVAGVPMWTSVDPLAEKYYNVSPYAYCHNNPVMLIDLDGRDDYDINSDGSITLKRQTSSSSDLIFSSNNNFIEVNKSFIQNHNHMTVNAQGSKSLDGNDVYEANVDMYGTSDINGATPIYEFFKNNTDVEWSKTVVGNSKEKMAFISTSHDEQGEVGQGIISTVIAEGCYQKDYPYISKYTDIYEASHSHYLGNSTVSESDVNMAIKIQTKFPQAKLTIYDGNTYYDFNKYSVPGLLPEVTCKGKAK